MGPSKQDDSNRLSCTNRGATQMTFQHMHHAMANKALMQAKYTEGLADKRSLLRRTHP